MAALLSYWFITYGLTNDIGWSLAWCAATLIIGVFVAIFLITIIIVGSGALMGSIANSVIFKFLYNIFFPLTVLGLVIRGLFIRLYATLRHPFAGLAQLPQNWRETLLVIDFLHHPELLPQASTIDPALGVRGARAMQQRFNWSNRLIGSIFLLPCIFLP